MKMKAKSSRALAALLALCLPLSLPVAANAEESDEKVLHVVVGKPSVVEDMNTNETSMWLEEITGIHVEYEQIPLENINEKVAMMLAGGELPDVFLNCGITAARSDR